MVLLGRRERGRQQREAGRNTATGRQPRKGERKTEQSHVVTQKRPLGSSHLPIGQVQQPSTVMEVNIMVALKEITWEEASSPDFGKPARQAWRSAVAEVAEKAQAKLPECASRVTKAVALVLRNDVELLADGAAKVASASNANLS